MFPFCRIGLLVFELLLIFLSFVAVSTTATVAKEVSEKAVCRRVRACVSHGMLIRARTEDVSVVLVSSGSDVLLYV